MDIEKLDEAVISEEDFQLEDEMVEEEIIEEVEEISEAEPSKSNNIEGIKINKDGKEYVSNPFLFKEIMRSKE